MGGLDPLKAWGPDTFVIQLDPIWTKPQKDDKGNKGPWGFCANFLQIQPLGLCHDKDWDNLIDGRFNRYETALYKSETGPGTLVNLFGGVKPGLTNGTKLVILN